MSSERKRVGFSSVVVPEDLRKIAHVVNRAMGGVIWPGEPVKIRVKGGQVVTGRVDLIQQRKIPHGGVLVRYLITLDADKFVVLLALVTVVALGHGCVAQECVSVDRPRPSAAAWRLVELQEY